MSWCNIIRKAVELLMALRAKMATGSVVTERKRITRASVDAQIQHQKELYKKNHPDGKQHR